MVFRLSPFLSFLDNYPCTCSSGLAHALCFWALQLCLWIANRHINFAHILILYLWLFPWEIMALHDYNKLHAYTLHAPYYHQRHTKLNCYLIIMCKYASLYTLILIIIIAVLWKLWWTGKSVQLIQLIVTIQYHYRLNYNVIHLFFICKT